MKGCKIKHLDKLKNKIPKKLVDIIVACLNPNPQYRCDLQFIWDRLDHKNVNTNANQTWFDEMKVLMYKQMTPFVIKEEMECKKFIVSALHMGLVNQLSRIF